MAAITPTTNYHGELAATTRIVNYGFTPGSASDTIVLTAAAHGVSEIVAILSVELTAGMDAALTNVSASFSSLTITILTYAAAGTAATDWTAATGTITLLVK